MYWSCGLVLEVDIESQSSERIKRNITVCDVEVSLVVSQLRLLGIILSEIAMARYFRDWHAITKTFSQNV